MKIVDSDNTASFEAAPSAYPEVWINADYMLTLRRTCSAVEFGIFMEICSEYWRTGVRVKEPRALSRYTGLTDDDIESGLSKVLPMMDVTADGVAPPADLWSATDPYIDEILAGKGVAV